MIKIAICDDEEEVIAEVKKCLENYKKEIIEVSNFSSGECLVSCSSSFDIIILDIDMDGMNGIEAAQQIRKKDKKVKIIYLTNYSDYTIFAFAVHAFAYLMKPVNQEELHRQLDEVLMYQPAVEEEELEFDTNDGILRFKPSDILYFEYEDRYIRMVTKQKEHWMKKKISDISMQMEPYHFEMTHKSFVVNLYHVKSIQGSDIVLSDDQRVPLSQKKAAWFRRQLNCYLSSIIGR